ncbi:lytic murein transglycosylase [Pseudonocardia sp. 73-21]|uniref:lytic murein transglycosylase n=1 Tax=Pseudonocardia sp. 73-21 TaxID=1895809 RepID=UPI000A7FE3FE|nr:lytic murein transglycosylase [Pseudonocardia sp. 73-21]
MGRVRSGAGVVAAIVAATVLSIPQSRTDAVVTVPAGPPRVQVELGALERAASPLPVLPLPALPPPAAAAPAPMPLPLPPVAPGVLDGGIPVRVLAAYRHAADLEAAADPGCGIDWALLAGIGRIESGHASGGRVDAAGTTRGRILGPVLDGSLPGSTVVPDSDGGALDGDVRYDRATGPMQFLPSTWRSVGADGNGDGVADPNNVDDAALGAARYLCAGGGDLRTVDGATAALFRYNRSAAYGADVLAWAAAYRTGTTAVPDLSGPVPAGDPGPQVLAAAEGAPAPPAPVPPAPVPPAPVPPAPVLVAQPPVAQPPVTQTSLAPTAPVPTVPGIPAPEAPPGGSTPGVSPQLPTGPPSPDRGPSAPAQPPSAQPPSDAPPSGSSTAAVTGPAAAGPPPVSTPPVTTAPATSTPMTKGPVTTAPATTAPATTAPATTTTTPASTAPAAAPAPPACPAATTVVASATRVLPDASGLLLRFALPDLPAGCRVTAATLRLDPGTAAATLTVRRPTATWSATTTAEPASTGPAVVSAPAAGTRRMAVTALVAALYAGPDNGLLVQGAGAPSGPVRLTVSFTR